MNSEQKRHIQLSEDRSEIEITTPIIAKVSNHLKHYFAQWDKPQHCWRLPITRLSGRAAHILNQEHQFTLQPEAAAAIREHFKKCPPEYKEHEGSLIIRGLEEREMHHFLRQRDRAQFLPEKDTWTIRPDYELAKYLLANLPRKQLENCRGYLETYTTTTAPLQRNSINGKILHEPGTPIISEGLTIAIGSRLHDIAKAAKIDYRLAIAFEGRPLPHTIGVAIYDRDVIRFQACADERNIQYSHHSSKDI